MDIKLQFSKNSKQHYVDTKLQFYGTSELHYCTLELRRIIYSTPSVKWAVQMSQNSVRSHFSIQEVQKVNE